ncbi:hypothetical protein OKW40_003576 [Paraburkholderia sp. RAU6.4a]
MLTVVQPGGERQTRTERGLARGRLAEAGGQHATDHRFVDLLGLQTRSFCGRLDRDRAELRRAQRREVALKAGHRRARRADDYDWIGVDTTVVCVTHVRAPWS